MSRITGQNVMKKFEPQVLVQNSFYEEGELVSSTPRTYRKGVAKSKFLYYVESDSNELKVRKTILMG